LSPGALRTRRYRDRRKRGAVAVAPELYADDIERLIRLGWLTPTARENKDVIERAVVAFTNAALITDSARAAYASTQARTDGSTLDRR
jgi:hypothetical protein